MTPREKVIALMDDVWCAERGVILAQETLAHRKIEMERVEWKLRCAERDMEEEDG